MHKVAGEVNRKVFHNLLELKRRKEDFNSQYFVSIYKKFTKFSPSQVLELFNGFEGTGIIYEAEHYAVSLKQSRFRYQLYRMTSSDRAKLWNSLSKDNQAFLRVINALIQLGMKDSDFDSISRIKYYIKVYAFTPRMLSHLLFLLEKNEVVHNVSDFKIYIMRSADRAQLGELEQWKIEKMWPALSYSQKEIYNNEFARNKIPMDFHS